MLSPTGDPPLPGSRTSTLQRSSHAVIGSPDNLNYDENRINRGRRGYTFLDDIRDLRTNNTNPFHSEQTYLKTPLPGPPSPKFKGREYLNDNFSPFVSPTEPIYRNTPTLAGIIGTVPSFSGEAEDNVDLFISHFERAARSGHWDDDMKLSVMISKLRGRALRSYNEGIGLLSEVGYEETRDHIIGLYRSRETKMEKTERFFRCSQRNEETVEAFYFRIKGLSCVLGSDPGIVQELLLEKFLDGMRSEIARQVIMYNPRNVLDALHKAKEVELVENRIGKRNKKVATVSGESLQQVGLDKTIKNQFEEIRREIGTLTLQMKGAGNERHTPAVIICEYCNGHNHTESRCPKRIRESLLLN